MPLPDILASSKILCSFASAELHEEDNELNSNYKSDENNELNSNYKSDLVDLLHL